MAKTTTTPPVIVPPVTPSVVVAPPWGSHENFLRAVMSAAASVRPEMSAKSRGLLSAWAALESGWGTSKAASVFNLFNVSRGSWTGRTINGPDTEFSPGAAVARPITQQWRAYESLIQGITDLFALLEKGPFANYHEAAAALLAGDEHFARKLGLYDRVNNVVTLMDKRPGVGGYYTMPRADYQARISRLWLEVQVLMDTLEMKNGVC